MQRIIELLIDNFQKTTGQQPAFFDGGQTFIQYLDNLYDGKSTLTTINRLGLQSRDIESLARIDSVRALLLNMFASVSKEKPLGVYLHNNKREKKIFDDVSFYKSLPTVGNEQEVIDLVFENDDYQLFVMASYLEPFARAKHVIHVDEKAYQVYTGVQTTAYPDAVYKDNFSRLFRILIAMLHSDEFHYFDVLKIARILLAVMMNRNPAKKTNLLILHWLPEERYSHYFSSLQKDVLNRYPMETLRVGQIFQNFIMYSLNLKAPAFEIYFFNYKYFFSLTDYAKVFPERYAYVQKRYFD